MNNDLHVNAGSGLVRLPGFAKADFLFSFWLLWLSTFPHIFLWDLPATHSPAPSSIHLPLLYVPICATPFALDPSDQRSGPPEPNSSDFTPASRVSRSYRSDRISFLGPIRLGLRLRDRRSDLARGPGSVLKKGGR